MAAGTPTLTYKTLPIPSVEVYWSTLPAGTTSITVYRLADGISTIVRNANNVSASGSFAVIDYEAPFGTAITYSAESFISGISDGISGTAVITLNVTDAWIQDPLDITSAIALSVDSAATDYTLGNGAFNSLRRSTIANMSKVLGRSAPVAQFYGRNSLTDVSVDVYSDNATFDDFNDLLDVQPLLFRAPAQLTNLPRILYCVVDAVEEPQDWSTASGTGLTKFSLTLTEVEGQNLSVLVNFYSYTDYANKYATYAATLAVYGASDYTNTVRNPLA